LTVPSATTHSFSVGGAGMFLCPGLSPPNYSNAR
jgi:hypothetical protein